MHEDVCLQYLEVLETSHHGRPTIVQHIPDLLGFGFISNEWRGGICHQSADLHLVWALLLGVGTHIGASACAWYERLNETVGN